MHPNELPAPYNTFQAVKANNTTDLKKLYMLIANKLGSKVPAIDLANLGAEILKVEEKYSRAAHKTPTETNPNPEETMPDLEKKARAGLPEAMTELSLSGSSKAFDILSFVAQTNPNEEVRQQAITALNNIDDKRKISLLGSILKKEKWQIAASCAQALGRSQDETAIPHLIQALKLDVDWLVSQKSAEALGFFKPSEAVTQALMIALNRGSFQGESAKQSLASQGEFAIPYLLKNLNKNPSCEGFSMTVQILGLIGNQSTINALIEAKQRIREFPIEDQWKRKLELEVDAAISGFH